MIWNGTHKIEVHEANTNINTHTHEDRYDTRSSRIKILSIINSFDMTWKETKKTLDEISANNINIDIPLSKINKANTEKVYNWELEEDIDETS